MRERDREGAGQPTCADCRMPHGTAEATAEELVGLWGWWLGESGLSEPEVVGLARDLVLTGV